MAVWGLRVQGGQSGTGWMGVREHAGEFEGLEGRGWGGWSCQGELRALKAVGGDGGIWRVRVMGPWVLFMRKGLGATEGLLARDPVSQGRGLGCLGHPGLFGRVCGHLGGGLMVS